MEIRERVIEIIAKTLRVEPSILHEQMEIGDIKEWDSLAQINLVLALEKEYNLTFDIDETLEMESILDIIEILEERFK